ncbi:uroporphyrinogen-III synthase [Rhodobium gokarnense]|uniref:Uroporphyrinogen-III synthase n=1 Tax=Rhodobium gokarnense TaxID=364296 RepID=A0ABT3HHJ3_9HYPH|nr:uroporphyrinogen-III synthase [Rhodobium gokarnense]MCW2309857.1 uroporphyrinogen-III synthase [Rhodobium gokarnense]
MRFLVTRPEPGASETARQLADLGHEALVDSLMHVVFDAEVPIALEGLSAVLVTSANGIRALAERADFSAISAVPLFAVGASTASLAREAGFAGAFSADGAVDDLVGLVSARLDPACGTLVYAAGAERTGDLDGKCRAKGFSVAVAEVYRTVVKTAFNPETIAGFRTKSLDGALIYSARTADAFVAAVRQNSLAEALKTLPLYAISAKAAAPLTAAGFEKIAIPARPDGADLLGLLPKNSD